MVGMGVCWKLRIGSYKFLLAMKRKQADVLRCQAGFGIIRGRLEGGGYVGGRKMKHDVWVLWAYRKS